MLPPLNPFTMYHSHDCPGAIEPGIICHYSCLLITVSSGRAADMVGWRTGARVRLGTDYLGGLSELSMGTLPNKVSRLLVGHMTYRGDTL